MKVLFDTNVLLDVLWDRKPHAEPAARLLGLAELGKLQGFFCATACTTIYYLSRKAAGAAKAREQIENLGSILEIAPVNRPVIERALQSRIRDFDDAVVAAAAIQVGADAVVTRNPRDFAQAEIAVQSPGDLLAALRTG